MPQLLEEHEPKIYQPKQPIRLARSHGLTPRAMRNESQGAGQGARCLARQVQDPREVPNQNQAERLDNICWPHKYGKNMAVQSGMETLLLVKYGKNVAFQSTGQMGCYSLSRIADGCKLHFCHHAIIHCDVSYGCFFGSSISISFEGVKLIQTRTLARHSSFALAQHACT